MIDEFCKSCEQKIPTNLFGKLQGHKFKDGWYCEECARVKVEKAREYKR